MATATADEKQAAALPPLPVMKVRVIPVLMCYGQGIDPETGEKMGRRHYPKSTGKPGAGEPFLIYAQDFEPASMRLAPDSKATFPEVVAYKEEWHRRNPRVSDIDNEKKGIFRTWIPPEDLGLDDGGLKEEGVGVSFASLQAQAPMQVQPMQQQPRPSKNREA